MYIKLFFLGVISLVVEVRTEDACERWKDHRNLHLLPSKDSCGKVKVNQEISSRILNGKEVARGSLPWMALLETDTGTQKYTCGGSVINEWYILTAAHCVLFGSTTKVYLGVDTQQGLILQALTGAVEQYNVEKPIIHPRFDNKTFRNDVALLRLTTSINLSSPKINHICLPTSCELARPNYFGENLTMAGWGDTSYKQTATTLEKVVLKGRECGNFTIKGVTYKHDWSHLCAGDGNVSVCLGDSGGPLMYETEGRFVQVGVSSLGPITDCVETTDDNAKSTFSRVASFVGWILKTIRP